MTKIFTTMVSLDDSGEISKCDTIEYEGKMWLVPHWLESPAQGWKTPTRIVCLDGLPHQKTPGSPFGDFVLTYPIPKALLLSGQVPKQSKFVIVVVESPDIRIPIQSGTH